MRHELSMRVSSISGVVVECACGQFLANDMTFTLGDLRQMWEAHLRDVGVIRPLNDKETS